MHSAVHVMPWFGIVVSHLDAVFGGPVWGLRVRSLYWPQIIIMSTLLGTTSSLLLIGSMVVEQPQLVTYHP